MKILSKHLSVGLRKFWSIGHKFDCIFDKNRYDSLAENQMVKFGISCLKDLKV
jgi:hypothetical protein